MEWALVKGRDAGNFVVYDRENEKAVTGWGHVEQTEAEARLLAAAPDLLLACQMLLNTCDQISWLHITSGEQCNCKSCAKKLARQAIEKAQHNKSLLQTA